MQRLCAGKERNDSLIIASWQILKRTYVNFEDMASWLLRTCRVGFTSVEA